MSGFDDPIVVEPVVSAEKLGELLGWETEYPSLEFKSDLAIALAEGIIELAKDVGAMQVRGGYIVIGVDGGGVPTGTITEDARPYYDESRLVQRLERYLPEPLNVRAAVHNLDGMLVALVYVGPHPGGCAFFHADGHYNRGKREVRVFHAGEVFWRKGTQSVRVNQQGFEEIVRKRIEDAKRAWLEDHGRATATQGSGLESISLDLDSGRLATAVLEAIRRNDEIAVRHVFIQVAAVARQLFNQDEFDVELGLVVDKVICLGCTAIQYQQHALLDRAIRSLQEIFDLGYTPDFSPYSTGLPKELRGPRVWLMIAERVYGLGALAVRLGRWEAVRDLAIVRVEDTERSTSPWLRHALTMASRAGRLTIHASGRKEQLSLINLARVHVDELDCLRTDGIDRGSEEALNSLLQFDVLVALAVTADRRGLDEREFYPNFSRFYATRVVPIVDQLIAPESRLRAVIFPLPDDDLAQALRTIQGWAQREAWHYAGFDGFGPRLVHWIDEHHPKPGGQPQP